MMGSSTILLVDDQPEILEALQGTLDAEDYHCVVAGDSETALAILERERVDLVLSDIRMPGMGGIDLLKLVAEKWPDTVRMTLSGYGDKDDVIEAINQGHVHAYFNKPWDSRALIRNMNSALRAKKNKAEQIATRARYVQTVKEQRDEAVNLFRSLTDTAVNSIMVIDESGKIIYWNRQAEVMFGYKGVEILGESIRSLLTPEGCGKNKRLSKRLKSFVEAGDGPFFVRPGRGPLTGETFEMVSMRRNGKEFPIEVSVSSVKQNKQWQTMAIVRDISERKRVEMERARHAEQLRQSMINTIQAIALTAEKRDPYTAGHQNRVARLAVSIASNLKLSVNQIEGILLGASIHDIGKIYVPSELLNRPGELTNGEFEIIKTHSLVGYDIMKDMEFPWPIAQMIRQHHERLDGSGYPDGLRGDDIIIEAQIIAVADVIDAITSHRPYRPAHGIDAAIEEIRNQSDILFNADVVDASLSVVEDNGFDFATPEGNA